MFLKDPKIKRPLFSNMQYLKRTSPHIRANAVFSAFAGLIFFVASSPGLTIYSIMTYLNQNVIQN
jgi:hypothetical protein